MAKKPAARKSAEQLKSMVWPDQESAERDIKASKVSLGDDSELREYRPGSWQIVPTDVSMEAPQEEAPKGDRESKIINSLRKKPGTKSRTEPEIVLDARKKPAKTEKPANVAKPEPEPEKPEPEPDEAGEKSVNPLSPLPVEDGPFEMVILPSERTFPNNAVVTQALDLSRRLRWPISIRDKSGAIVREIDSVALRAAGPGRGRPLNSGAPKAVGKSAEAAKLLMRENGATFDEVQQITEWGISERFVRRLAKSHKCEPVMIADRHWKLVKLAA